MNLEIIYWNLNDKLRFYELEMPSSIPSEAERFLSGWSRTFSLMTRIADRLYLSDPKSKVAVHFRENLDDYILPGDISELAEFGM